MNNLDKQYQNLLQEIIDKGVSKEDRTGTGTKSIFSAQIKHDMEEGFPLLTTKRVYWKGIVTELLWFLRGDTNVKWLVENGNNIWVGDSYKNYLTNFKNDLYGSQAARLLECPTQEEFINKIKTDDEFAKKWGELGPIYGAQWRNYKTTRVVEDILPYRKSPNVLNVLPQFPTIPPDYTQNRMGLVGKTFKSNNYGDFIVINEYYENKHLRYNIQFTLTNYVLTSRTKQQISQTLEVRDPYYPSVYGVGCLGELPNNSLISKLRSTWEGMLSRCYNPNDRMFHLYGGKEYMLKIDGCYLLTLLKMFNN